MPPSMCPAEAVDAYKKAKPWSGFGTIVALTEEEIVGIENIKMDLSTPAIFTLDGKQTDTLQKGINIIRTGNQTKKVYVK